MVKFSNNLYFLVVVLQEIQLLIGMQFTEVNETQKARFLVTNSDTRGF